MGPLISSVGTRLRRLRLCSIWGCFMSMDLGWRKVLKEPLTTSSNPPNCPTPQPKTKSVTAISVDMLYLQTDNLPSDATLSHKL